MIETDKIFETMVSKTLVLGNEEQWSLKNRKQMRWVLPLSQFNVLKMSRLQRREGEPKQKWVDSLSWENRAKSLRRHRWLGFAGHSTGKKELNRSRNPGISRVSFNIQQSPDQCVHVRKLPETGERTIRKALQRAGNSNCPHQSD